MTPGLIEMFTAAFLALGAFFEWRRRVRKRNSDRPAEALPSDPDATDPDLPRHPRKSRPPRRWGGP